MVFPVAVEKFQVKYFNPLIKPFARYMPGMATIKHRGRKSGAPYETIVTAYRKGNVLAISLGHGKTDWVKNVLRRARPTCTSSGETCTSSTPGFCLQAAAPKGCRSWPRCSRKESGSSSRISLDRADTLTPWRGESG